eukprot:1153687-Pelagomonas_calceolata.AAC.5
MAMSGKLGGEGGCVRCALRSGCPASSADLGLLLRLPAMHAGGNDVEKDGDTLLVQDLCEGSKSRRFRGLSRCLAQGRPQSGQKS